MIRRRTYERRFTELGQSYRRSIEEAHAERDKARRDLQRFIDALAPTVSTHKRVGQPMRIFVDVDERLLIRGTQQEIFERVRDSIMRRLTDAGRDYRGDLRQTIAQRMLTP